MVVLGRITAPFGIQGWVKIHPFGDDPLAWRRMKHWWVSPDDTLDDSAWRQLHLKACRLHGGTLVARFEEIADRSAAEQLGKLFIGAPRDAMPEPGEDEYYWGDLIGLAVENRSGVQLGTVSGLIETGAHDVLQVRDNTDGTERLIPFVEAYVGEVDLTARRILVDWELDW
ncbi:MAG: ribosome maturation factor RimM [Rhodocyclaceae bacterium]|nr:ribosome maturation factor RimM [Rhodocyclaceae bacterium]